MSHRRGQLLAADEARRITANIAMSDELLQFIIVVVFGAVCFGCGVFTAFIVTRNKYRDEMIKRGVARYDHLTGKWEWGELPKQSRTWKVE